MTSRMREAIAPLYLLLCLVLGGSAQGIWANMILQLLGLAIIAWAALPAGGGPVGGPARQFLVIAMLGLALVAIQLVPLPPGVWTRMAGRAPIADGYRILGLGEPWLPLSLAPYRSLDAVLGGVVPPLALFLAVVSLRAYRPSWLAGALLAGTIAGVALGALQVGSGGQESSPWYLYPESTYGLATGFFANANHMADLLVCTLPFLAAAANSALARSGRNSAILIGVVAAALLVLVGIGLNRSLAVYGLTPPLVVASVLIFLPPTSHWRRWVLVASAVFLAGGVAALTTSSVQPAAFGDTSTSVTSREEMLATTSHAIRDFMPWGSGLGSFRSVYHLYEDPVRVNDTYVIHAHDDYVELALETGLPGILLMIAFLWWWARQLWSAWTYPEAGAYARAAAIASAAILAHSLVDFPLRTTAIAAVFAMCLALLVERRTIPVRSKADLRPTRHIVIR